jgi:hypothetical protein
MKPIERIKEGSTWAGFAAVLQGLKLVFPAHSAILDGLTMISGSVAAIIPDKGATK